MGGFREYRATLVAVWLVSIVGAALVVVASLVGFVADPPPSSFLILLVAAVYFSARPMVVLRHPSHVFVEVGSAFSLGALYAWGLPPAVMLTAISWVVGNAVRQKRPLVFAFNVANLVLSVAAAWLVMAAAGHPGGLGESLQWDDIWWVPLTWAAHFVVNLGLLAYGIRALGAARWQTFRCELPWHLVSESVGFTLSPVVVALVAEGPLAALLLAAPLALISETYAVTRRTEYDALHDPLTDLANRRRFLQAVEGQVEHGTPFVLLLVDLDRFKRVNDAHGHLAGDATLVEAAHRLAGAVREGDLVARLGGDEFALLLAGRASRPEAQEVARRVHSSLIRPVDAGGTTVAVGASVGVVLVSRTEPVDVDLAFHRADLAMYAAKTTGAGIRIWTPDLEAVAEGEATKAL